MAQHCKERKGIMLYHLEILASAAHQIPQAWEEDLIYQQDLPMQNLHWARPLHQHLQHEAAASLCFLLLRKLGAQVRTV